MKAESSILLTEDGIDTWLNSLQQLKAKFWIDLREGGRDISVRNTQYAKAFLLITSNEDGSSKLTTDNNEQ